MDCHEWRIRLACSHDRVQKTRTLGLVGTDLPAGSYPALDYAILLVVFYHDPTFGAGGLVDSG
jgi:hypothetical protein